MRIFTKLLLFVALVAFASGISAQNRRYLDPVFDKVKVSPLTPVASNYTVMTWIGGLLQGVPGVHTARQPLVCQFYTPDGDTRTDRPLVIYVHTGSFLPYQINASCGGTMADSSNVEIAKRLAKMGYVVAVVNYRQGWIPTLEQELLKRYFLINATYRGVQDISTYVRYFRRSVADLGNPHGIDPEKITVWGQGTGGYISLASAYLQEYNQIFQTSDPLKFWLTPPLTPVNIPMVREQYNGLVDASGPVATVDAQYSALNLGLPVGDTLCIPNHTGFSNRFALCVNMGGALGDSTWVRSGAGNPPLVSYHVKTDQYAPCETDVLNVPTTRGPEPVVEVSGSCDVSRIADRLGLNEVFKSIPAGHDPYGALSKTGRLGYYQFDNTPDDSGSPWEWQASATPKPTTDPSVTDCNTDAAKSRMYIDTIVGYFAPRACVALGLNCDFNSSVKDLTDTNVNLKMAPNPATSDVTISVSDATPVRSWTVFDISGRMVRSNAQANTTSFVLRRDNLQNGMYLVKMQFDKGTLTKKLIFE